MRRRSGFSLPELLIVIVITAVLMAILVPALSYVREQARCAVCRTNLKTLALANELYSNSCDGWLVPAVDFTPAATEGPTWNSNREFCKAVGVQKSIKEIETSVAAGEPVDYASIMPREYICPTDAPVGNIPTLGAFRDIVSYGYNVTDWGPDSWYHITWAEEGPSEDAVAQIKATHVRRPAEKLMFIDAGDIWALKSGADYKRLWDRFGPNLEKYRSEGEWMPTFYRHSEGANVAFVDGHAEYMRKQEIFHYQGQTSYPDHETNNRLWYIIPENFDPAKR